MRVLRVRIWSRSANAEAYLEPGHDRVGGWFGRTKMIKAFNGSQLMYKALPSLELIE